MNIKVDKKYGEQDRFLDNVIIHKKTDQNINNTVIKAKNNTNTIRLRIPLCRDIPEAFMAANS